MGVGRGGRSSDDALLKKESQLNGCATKASLELVGVPGLAVAQKWVHGWVVVIAPSFLGLTRSGFRRHSPRKPSSSS